MGRRGVRDLLGITGCAGFGWLSRLAKGGKRWMAGGAAGPPKRL